jgi:hypothetical protein
MPQRIRRSTPTDVAENAFAPRIFTRPLRRVVVAVSVVLSIVAASLLAASPAAAADPTFSSAGITYSYTESDGQATITKAVVPSGTKVLSIPASTGTYGVNVIGNGVFAEMGLTSVTIPDTVTDIGEGSFESNSLTSLSLGAEVGYIGYRAFADNQLISLTMPDLLKYIDDYAFTQNSSLHTVLLNEGLTTIGESAFSSDGLTAITIPDSVTEIGQYAFDTNKLDAVTIGSGITNIPFGAFAFNPLTHITIPAQVKSIDDLAFYENPGLISVTFDGDAPTTFTAASGSSNGSLIVPQGNTAQMAKLTVYSYEGAKDFTTPTWKGYKSSVIKRPAALVDGSSLFTLNAEGSDYSEQNLFSINPASAAATLIGGETVNPGSMNYSQPLAWNAKGTSAYFIIRGNLGVGPSINKLDIATGAISDSFALTATFSVYEASAMAIGRNGAAYIITRTTGGDLFLSSLNLGTGGLTYIATLDLGSPGPTLGGFAVDPSTGLFWIFDVDSGSPNRLIQVDVATGVLSNATSITNLDSDFYASSLQFDSDGTRWLLGANSPQNAILYSVVAAGSSAVNSGFVKHNATKLTAYSLLLVPVSTAIDAAPEFTNNTPTAANVGTAYSYTYTASGSPAPTFSTTDALPAGLTLNGTTGELSGTPTGTGGVSAAFTVKASNTITPDAPGTANTITVAAAPKFIGDGPATTATFGIAYNYTFAASGYPTATTFTIESGDGSLPTGLSLSSAGVISGSPTGGAGTSTFTVTANNTTAPNAVSASHSITVSVPVAPAFTSDSPPDTATVGEEYYYPFEASGSPAPTFTISGTALPAEWSLSADGVLTGNASTVYANVITFTVKATNGSGDAFSEEHTITIQPAPASPLFTANTPNSWATVGTVYESYQFTATGYPAPTFSAVGEVPAGLTLSESGLLSGTPTGVGGDVSFTVIASNNVNPFDSVELTFVVSAAPILTSDSPPATALTGTAFAGYTFTATGSPRPTFSLGSGALPAGMTIGSVSGGLAGTPSSGSGGVYTFTVKASNEVGSPALGASHTLTVSQPPVLTADLPGLTATSGTAYPGYTFEASGFPAPIFVVTGNLPNGLGVDPASGVLSGTPSDDAGDYTFSVTARNDVGTAAVGASHTLVLSVPAAPVFGADSPPIAATVGTAYTYTFTATGYPAPTFSSTTLPTGWVLSTAGVLTAMPTTDMVYEQPIEFTVTASNGVSPAAVGVEHTITVSPAPAVPVFTVDSPASTGVVGTPYVSHQFEASGYPVPTLTVNDADLPAGLTFTDGLLSGTPTGVGGVFTFTVHAGNSVDADVPGIEHTVTISAAPIFTAQSPALTATVGTAYTPYTYTASGYPTTMTFTVASGELPAGMTLTAGVLSGTPTGIGGTYTFTVTASNTVGSPVSSTSTTIVVSAAPVLTADVPTNAATVGVDYSFTYTGTGTPTPTFAVSAGVLPAGLSLSGAGVLSGTPTGTGGVSDGFTVTASNRVADTAGASRTLTVAAAPIFTDGVPTLTATVGTAYVGHTFTATGFPTPTFTVGSLPPGFTFDNGVLAGTPTGVGGTFTIQVTAHNATANVDAVARTFIVDAAPVVTADEPTSTATVGTAYSFTYAATGYPTPTFAVTAGTLPAGLTLSGAGVLSGTPTGTGGVSDGFTVTASNRVDDTVGASRTITVSAAPILTADAPPTPAVGVAYSYTFTATGFPAPAFTSSGTLPAGLTLSEEGVLEGIATIPGSYTFTITAANNVVPDAGGTPHTLVVAVPALNLQLGFEVGSVVGGATSTATAVGLMVDSPWIVQVFSTPHTIASGFVGNTGAINANIGLPTTLEPGLHHLVFTGMSASGETLTTTVWFTVSVKGTFLAISTVGPTKTEAELAKTGPGADSGSWLFWALLAMVAGAGMVLKRRRLTPR